MPNLVSIIQWQCPPPVPSINDMGENLMAASGPFFKEILANFGQHIGNAMIEKSNHRVIASKIIEFPRSHLLYTLINRPVNSLDEIIIQCHGDQQKVLIEPCRFRIRLSLEADIKSAMINLGGLFQNTLAAQVTHEQRVWCNGQPTNYYSIDFHHQDILIAPFEGNHHFLYERVMNFYKFAFYLLCP